jgi:hypothetical protein
MTRKATEGKPLLIERAKAGGDAFNFLNEEFI